MTRAKRKPRARKSQRKSARKDAPHFEPKDVPPDAKPTITRANIRVRPFPIRKKTLREAMAEVVAIMLEED